MTVTSHKTSANVELSPITCTIGIASALFNMSDARFVARYLKNGKIPVDRLHRMRMRDVLRAYKP